MANVQIQPEIGSVPGQIPMEKSMGNLTLENACQIFRDLIQILSDRLTKYRNAYTNAKCMDEFFKAYFRCNDVIDILAGPYVRVYQILGVDCKIDFDQKVHAFIREFDDDNFHQYVDDLRKVENDWDDLLLKIDQRMLSDHITSRGFQSVMPDQIELIDCDNDQPITLKSCLDSIDTKCQHTLLVLLRFYG